MGLPSKHETLNQSLVDVGPSSTTLAQHQPNIGSMYRGNLLVPLQASVCH